jgi:uncharacterized repeat protein (TIGR03803 family)
LAIDSAGNIYGYDGSGNIFQLFYAVGAWFVSNLHTFPSSETDGALPLGSPTVDSEGNVYGTTLFGGKHGFGTVWKLTPITKGRGIGDYREKVIYSFKAAKDGVNNSPGVGVTVDSSGNIFGTTNYSSTGTSCGTVYELGAVGSTVYKYKDLWNFDNVDGCNPAATVIVDGSGILYGVTTYGGQSNNLSQRQGIVYELQP